MMQDYRQKLVEAAYALVGTGDINMRLTHATGCLLQLDDDDVPAGALEAFERILDPLIQKPIVARGEMQARDFSEAEAITVARGILELLMAEFGGPHGGSA